MNAGFDSREMKTTTNPEIDVVIDAFYRAFDNRGTQAPSADALRSLFAAGGRITRVAAGTVEEWTVDEFIAPRIAILTNGTLTGFHEWEARSRTTVFDNIASRESHYRKSGTLNGVPYFGAGRKLIQLCRFDRSWLICSILWEDD
jgi:hypothetical protein